jgi:hypothetical protein
VFECIRQQRWLEGYLSGHDWTQINWEKNLVCFCLLIFFFLALFFLILFNIIAIRICRV